MIRREMDAEVLTYLEMTSPAQLLPARPPPAPLRLEEAGPAEAPLLASTYVRIWAPLGSGGRSGWSERDWQEELARPGVRAWLAYADDEPIGLFELESEPTGDVGIVVLGIVPEFVGRGFGGHLLTVAARLAWEAGHPDGTATRRVWLHTASSDHAHALQNYLARGFRVVRTEVRHKQVPSSG